MFLKRKIVWMPSSVVLKKVENWLNQNLKRKILNWLLLSKKKEQKMFGLVFMTYLKKVISSIKVIIPNANTQIGLLISQTIVKNVQEVKTM